MNFSALLLGLMIVGIGLYLGKKNGVTKKWAKTEGKILHKEVAKTKEAVAVGPPAFRLEAVVKYEYTVDSKKYSNDKVFFGAHELRSQEDAQRFIRDLKDLVVVNYNPQNPAESCLFTMPMWIFWAVCGVGAFFVLVGLASNT